MFKESYLQLLGQWLACLNLTKVRNTENHLGTEGIGYNELEVCPMDQGLGDS